ncbi:hypothetical protein DB30_06732 [Enhygromyxa salina]|uniref:Carboxypeptidase regulatory-like domain-containing protein n=1 Tax=Enhygromyxa salina TaxID=215803 RepID=A0A0C2CXX8_9BACT|nr:hypothetical protein DB30_06732 [Enhygromyxa salina]
MTDTTAMTEPELARLLDASETTRTCVRIERDGDRLRLASGLAAGIVALVLAGCATAGAQRDGSTPNAQLARLPAGSPGEIQGVIRDTGGQRIEDAVVILQSVALEGERSLLTGPSGAYRFEQLPPGTYTVQVLVNRANVSKIVTLDAGSDPASGVAASGVRVNFKISPEAMSDGVTLGVVVCEPRIRMDASSSYNSSLVWIGD